MANCPFVIVGSISAFVLMISVRIIYFGLIFILINPAYLEIIIHVFTSYDTNISELRGCLWL
jgi:hypothetical protein